MNLAKVRFHAAQNIKLFYYHVHKYPITYERIYQEFDKSIFVMTPTTDETMTLYFELVLADYKKDLKNFGIEQLKTTIKEQLAQCGEALGQGYPFAYGTNDTLSVNAEINARCFWEYCKAFHETLIQNPNLELTDIFLLDKCVFMPLTLTSIPQTERDKFMASEDQSLVTIAKREGLTVFIDVCCRKTIELVESVKYQNPGLTDIKILVNHCIKKVIDSPCDIEEFKNSIDNLLNVSEKLSNKEMQDIYIQSGIDKLKARTINYSHHIEIPPFKKVLEYYNSVNPLVKTIPGQSETISDLPKTFEELFYNPEKTVFSLTIEDLQTVIIDCVNACLRNNKQQLDTTTPDKLLTVQEAAEFLNLEVPTIYSKISLRELPHHKRGKRLYFSLDELTAYVKDGKRLTKDERKSLSNNKNRRMGGP